ncbi:MAG: IS200/IS605 family transposase [Candidatus Saganbacteria bacterium]|nr:IS200/IS605 family transposase [Candidatus Saganbacteria bacterium]
MKYYHVWFQTKAKKFILIDEIDLRVHQLFKLIADEKGYLLVASGSLPVHVHILLGLNDDQDISVAVKNIKGITARRIFLEYNMLKCQLRVKNLWARRFAWKNIPEDRLEMVTDYVNKQKKDLYIV